VISIDALTPAPRSCFRPTTTTAIRITAVNAVRVSDFMRFPANQTAFAASQRSDFSTPAIGEKHEKAALPSPLAGEGSGMRGQTSIDAKIALTRSTDRNKADRKFADADATRQHHGSARHFDRDWQKKKPHSPERVGFSKSCIVVVPHLATSR
jgi:hypothetical protein